MYREIVVAGKMELVVLLHKLRQPLAKKILDGILESKNTTNALDSIADHRTNLTRLPWLVGYVGVTTGGGGIRPKAVHGLV